MAVTELPPKAEAARAVVQVASRVAGTTAVLTLQLHLHCLSRCWAAHPAPQLAAQMLLMSRGGETSYLRPAVG